MTVIWQCQYGSVSNGAPLKYGDVQEYYGIGPEIAASKFVFNKCVTDDASAIIAETALVSGIWVCEMFLEATADNPLRIYFGTVLVWRREVRE